MKTLTRPQGLLYVRFPWKGGRMGSRTYSMLANDHSEKNRKDI